MADKTFFGLLLLTAFVTAVYGGEWCTDISDDWFDTDKNTIYCESSCCGDAYNRYCCFHAEVGMIVGIVIGVLVLLGVIISIIVGVCCCRRQRGRQGQVVGGPGAGVVNMGATVPPYTTTTTTVGYPGYPQMPQTTVPAYPQMPAANQPYPGQTPAQQPYGQPYGQSAPQATGNQAPPSYEELQHKNEPK